MPEALQLKVRSSTEDGQTVKDPNPSDVARLFGSLGQGNSFLLLEQVDETGWRVSLHVRLEQVNRRMETCGVADDAQRMIRYGP